MTAKNKLCAVVLAITTAFGIAACANAPAPPDKKGTDSDKVADNDKAVMPFYTYQAAYSVNAVGIDGTIADGEWDEAVALVMDVNNETFLEYGEFQGDDAKSVFTENNFRAIVKVKWDEEYLYILEDRYNGKIPFYHTEADATSPWRGAAGTLFFFAPDTGDGTDLDKNNLQIFWVDKTKSNGNASAAVRGFIGSGKAWTTVRVPSEWLYAATVDTGTNHGIFEIKIPWEDVASFGGSAMPVGGEKFRFNPIFKLGHPDVSAQNGQYAFYNYGIGSKHNDLVTTNARDKIGGEIPINWAGLVLAAKPAQND
jgi:hypothetical protein